jgi:steroid 5-alpha reductase family enzyme
MEAVHVHVGPKKPMSLNAGRMLVTVAYIVAGIVSVIGAYYAPTDDPLWIGAYGDVAATLAVFAFSLAFNNSSFYDAYWSVIPPALGAYWITVAEPDANPARQWLALGLCTLWAVRLTYNWGRGWTGLGHEDWRYVDLRRTTGKAYWLVSLFGLHMFPTFQVFAGCVGMYVALTAGGHAFGIVDIAAIVVTFGAIAIETIADEQLRAFTLRPNKPKGVTMNEGLWAYSRHPNYFGEMMFWWGMFLFGYAADPSRVGIMLVGPVAISVMFFFVSVPMMEKRQLEKRPSFAEQVATTSMIIPWFRKAPKNA